MTTRSARVAASRTAAAIVSGSSGRISLRDGVATPLFGASALLSVLTEADGYLLVPDDATGLQGGTEVDVRLYA